jgi:hypothetical protein
MYEKQCLHSTVPQNVDKLEIHVHGATESFYMTVLCSVWNRLIIIVMCVELLIRLVLQEAIQTMRLALHALQISLLRRPYFC